MSTNTHSRQPFSPSLNSQAAWDALLARLAQERGGDAATAYPKLHTDLQRYFTLQGDDEPAEAADVTLDRVARHLWEDRSIQQVFHYTIGVARLVCLERRRRRAQTQAVAQSLVAEAPASVSAGDTAETDAGEEKLAAMQRCLARLSPAEQSLLRAYCAEEKAVTQEATRLRLAAERNMTLNGLRVQVHRLRARMEKCLRKSFPAP